MRILATTDFHGNAGAFRETSLKARQSKADIVIVCGDITHFGLPQQAKELLSLINTSPLLFVPGNCDPPSLANEETGIAESIHGKCKQINNVSFLGVGGSSPSPFHTPFELSEEEITDILRQAYNACETKPQTILVSHSPPKDTKVDFTFTRKHAGSASVRYFIERTRPQLVICGHIHEATGTDTIDGTAIVNPGPARHGKCAVIDINGATNIKLDQL